MMRRTAILLWTACLSLLPAMQARGQETPVHYARPVTAVERAVERLEVYFEPSLPAWTDTRWLQAEVDPIERARRALRERMRDEAEKAALAADETARPRDPQIVTDRLRITLGNNTDRSWSPYPDRALDARALRFPLPRDARADKRTEQQKALDHIRGRK